MNVPTQPETSDSRPIRLESDLSHHSPDVVTAALIECAHCRELHVGECAVEVLDDPDACPVEHLREKDADS